MDIRYKLNLSVFFFILLFGLNPSILAKSNSPKLKKLYKLIQENEDKKEKKETKLEKAPNKKEIYYFNLKDVENDKFMLPSIIPDELFKKYIQSDIIKREIAPAGKIIKFLYNKGIINSAIRSVGNLKLLTVLYGYYNNRHISEKQTYHFLQDILKLELTTENFWQENNKFQHLYGKGLDGYRTINQIFSRQLLPERMQEILQKETFKKGDIVSNSTARIRIFSDVNPDSSFHLVDKTIGGSRNSFNIWRLFGHPKKKRTYGLAHERSKILKELEKNQKNLVKSISNFTLKKLVKKRKNSYSRKLDETLSSILLHAIVLNLKGSTMMVNRLAPEDYHHIHFPFYEGKILGRKQLAKTILSKIDSYDTTPKLKLFYKQALSYYLDENYEEDKNPSFHIDGEFKSVSTIATTSQALRYNPLTENIRDIVFITTPNLDIVPLIFVGATGVGKNKISVKTNQKLSAGDNVGHFEFGGSTTVTFYPAGKISILPNIIKASDISFWITSKHKKNGSKKFLRKLEFYTEVGTPLFKEVP